MFRNECLTGFNLFQEILQLLKYSHLHIDLDHSISNRPIVCRNNQEYWRSVDHWICRSTTIFLFHSFVLLLIFCYVLLLWFSFVCLFFFFSSGFLSFFKLIVSLFLSFDLSFVLSIFRFSIILFLWFRIGIHWAPRLWFGQI